MNSGVGGKAESLFKLSSAGFRVPDFFVIDDKHFQNYLSGLESYQDFKESFLSSKEDSLLKAARLRQELETGNLDSILRQEIESGLAKIKSEYFSVRSSAIGEDSLGHSFAGQMDSFLFCKGLDEIENSVKKCWASLFSERAITYRKLNKLFELPFGMGVVVQEMLNADVSGVAFSVNPINSDMDQVLISATYGLGEGLVSGALDADQMVYSKSKRKIVSEEIAQKQRQMSFNTELGRGTCEEVIGDEKANQSCLKPEQIEEIAEICQRIEKHDGFPQDVEWSYAKGQLYVLQSRPITTLADPWRFSNEGRQELSSYETIWDNSNIVESYSGVTTPLTFSFAKHCYHIVYVQFCEILGVPKKKILEFDFAFQNMLGLIEGRIYYNLKNWYRLISVLPGYQYNKEFMEQMMGVKESTDFLTSERKSPLLERYFIDLPRLVFAGLRLFYRFLRLDRDVASFSQIVSETFDKYKNFDFKTKSLHEIVDTYYEIENRVLRNWKPPIVNDFMAMIFYGLLQKLLKNWKIDETGSLQNELLCAQGDVESTLPILELQKIASFIQKDPALKRAFQEAKPEELKSRFLDGNESPSLRQKMEAYLDAYGFRCMNELKLEEPSLQEKPEFVFKILKNYSSGSSQHSIGSGQDSSLAYQKVIEKLQGRRVFLIIPKTWIFNFVLSYAKKAVKVREYQRFARTKMFGIMRNLFNAAGWKLERLGVLNEAKDVFYLSRQELFDYIVGASLTKDIGELTRLRKQEFESFQKEAEPADRIALRGAVYLHRFQAPISSEASDGVLKGTSCCPGKVKGPVKVILSPSDDMELNGEILVAGRTDPGWVTLYPSASGLLIERGSILSHSAIVARELGLPAIVGIPNITKLVSSGDWVEMDGQSGQVSILGAASENEVQRANQ